MPLTDTDCRNAKCPQDKLRARFADGEGLYLEVLPAGGKYWRLKYRFGGKEKRLALGVYDGVSLKAARLARAEARALLAKKVDPAAERRDAGRIEAIAQTNSFEAVARAWHAKWKAEKSARHADYVIRRLESDVFPEIGSRPVSSITAPQLVAMATKIESRGASDLAKRSLQTCGQILRFAVVKGFTERNAARDFKPSDALSTPDTAHFARIEAKELPELLRKIEAYQGSPYTRFAMKLMALTFVRTGELINARWSEFDLEAAEWRIPAERMKMKTPHIVPLSRQAVDILSCLHELRGLSGLLFPGERDHDKPMSNNTILGALKRMGYAGRMTGHGFRGLASTILHEQQYEHAHIELQLAHLHGDDVSRAYDAAKHIPQRRQMLQDWADYLDSARKGAKVLPMKAA